MQLTNQEHVSLGLSLINVQFAIDFFKWLWIRWIFYVSKLFVLLFCVFFFLRKSPLGSRFPKTGQTVVVHYTGTLTNGNKFDSSRDRGKPFKFKIGRGEVIKGWDEGVARVNETAFSFYFNCICVERLFSFDFYWIPEQMSIGERAKLTCSPDYAYGERGHPGIIPPNSTLIFDVELLSIE